MEIVVLTVVVVVVNVMKVGNVAVIAFKICTIGDASV
jgi:hypothetical protein